MKITNKTDMYELLKAGKLGNTFRTWASVAEAIADNYHGPFGLRTSIKNGPAFPGDMSLSAALAAEKKCAHAQFLAFCEYVPQAAATFNAEIMRDPDGLYIRYKMGPMHMRVAMSNCDHARGVMAAALLCKFLGDDGMEQIEYLLDTYDEGRVSSETAVIEATAFSVPVGVEHKHYIIWEVRSY